MVNGFPRPDLRPGAGSSQRGIGLVVAMVALVLVTLTVLLLASLLKGRSDGYRARHRTVVLVSLSDAACAETLARLAANPDSTGVVRRVLGDGVIESRVSGSGQGRRLVVAEGRYAGWRGTVTAEVEVGDGGPRVVSWNRTIAPSGPGAPEATGSFH
jgi:hypothetical protein